MTYLKKNKRKKKHIRNQANTAKKRCSIKMIELYVYKHIYRNNNEIVAIGKKIYATKILISTNSNRNKIATSVMIKIDLTKIPMAIENRTRPGRYSFLRGLKNVLRRSGSEKSCKKEALSETKNLKSAIGLSRNQNLKNTTGRIA